MVKILFVCLGNICRSPSAEAVFKHFIEDTNSQSKISCDSAGTYGGHAGHKADSRMQKHAVLRGYNLTSISRQFIQSDFETFDLIIGMDDSNIRDIKRLDTENIYGDKIVKMTDYSRRSNYTEVPDPYYGGSQGFELVLDILEDSCESLIEMLLQK